MATFSDGSSKDVGAEAEWTFTPIGNCNQKLCGGAMTVIEGEQAFLQGTERGIVRVTASYQGKGSDYFSVSIE